jgi:hypothetical protein
VPTPTKILTKEDILRAMKMTRSNLAAARYLHVSYNHYKKYAKMYKNDEGVTLLEVHKNQSGTGIPKFALKGSSKIPLMDLLEGRVPIEHFKAKEIKERLIFEGMIEEKCAKCGFSERRIKDTKVPVILNFIDGNKKNWHLDNLEFLCYNCSFLYAASPIEEKQAEAMEDYVKTRDDEPDWELDEAHIEHLKSLGLYDDEEEKNDGSEYISRI